MQNNYQVIALYRILYVDDEPSLLEIGKLFLEESRQFSVDIIPSAPAALTLMNTKNYDAIISDYQMPKMDGIEFLKRVRASGNTIPFILFTGRGREEVVIQALNEGADFYLQKGGEPVAQFAELEHKIRQAIQQRRAEASIRDHERREADIINFLPDATFAIDTHGVVIAWNHAMEEMTGVRAAEMMGKGNYEYSIPVYRERRPILIDMILHDDPTIAAKYPSLKKDGHSLIAEAVSPNLYNGRGAAIWFTAAPLYNTKGEVVGAIESIRNISERKQAEEVITKSRHQLAEAMDLAHLVNWEYDVGTGIFTFDDRFYALFGTTAEREGGYQMEAEKYARVFLHPDDQHLVAEEVKKDIETADPNYQSALEHRIIRRDGEVRYVLVRIRITKDAQGRTIKTHGANQDITDLKRAEGALQHQSATLTILNGIISTANKADNLPQLLSSILEESLHLLDFDVGGIYLVDRSSRTAHVVHSKNLPQEFLAEIQPLPIDKKPYDTLFIKNEPIITENYAQIAPDRSKKYGFLSLASIPLLSKGVAIGALNIASKRRQVISEEEKQTLISISRELGSTIERMAAEENVKKSAKNFETLFNSIDEMIFVLDMRGNILAVNDTVQKRLSYTSEELIGTNVLQVHVPERRDEALIIVEGMIPGTIDSCLVPVLAKDGTRIEVETKVTRGWWNGNEALIGVSRDITKRKRAEEALRESHDRFKATIASLDDAVFLVDPATLLIIECNDASTRIFGYSYEELIGRGTGFLHVDQAHLEQFGREARATYEDPGYYRREFQMRRKDGCVFPTEHFVRPIYDPDGRILYVVSVVRDITERKRAEDAIRESEERYRSILENIQDVYYRSDTAGNFLMISPSITHMLGYDIASELLGKNIAKSIYYNPEERSKFLDELNPQGSVTDYEVTLKKRDGTPVYVSTSSHKYYDHAGNYLGIEGVFRDITQRKQVEDALLESEEKYRRIVETANEGVWVVDQDLNTSFVNQRFADMIGYSREEMVGHNIMDYVINDDKTTVETQFIARRTGIKGRYECKLRHRDGRVVWCLISGSPLMDDTGSFKGSFGMVMDISKRKQYEIELLKNAEEFRAANEQIAAAEEELRANLDELGRQELTLRESKKELADIIDFLPDATFAINTSGVVIAWNHAMEVMTGVKKEEMLNKGDYEYSLPFYRERRPILIDLVFGYDECVAEKYQSIRKDGDRLIAEIFIPHFHNGRGAYLWFTTSPLYNSQGKITGAIESIREITEHKERESALNLRNEELSAAYEEITSTEEELRQQVEEIATAQRMMQETEGRYRNIVEDQTEFISRFLPDGKHIFVNDAYCRYFSVAKEDIIGHRFRPVLHADDRAAVAAFFASLTPEKPVGTIDQRIIMPNGTIRWQRWSDRGLFDKNGNVVEYQSVGRDITKNKQVEKQLQKTVKEYESLLNNMSDGYYRSDEKGNLILASRSIATLLGYPDLSECIGKNIASTFYADPDERKLFMEKISREGSVTDYDVVLKKKDGSPVTVATSSYLYSDGAGHVLGVEGTLRDITERKRITDTLRETEQRLTDIINFLPDATLAVDRDGRVIAWNRAIEEMTGVYAEDMIGKGNYEYALPFYGERRPILIDLIFKDDTELKNYSSVRREGDILTAETGMAHLGGKNLILWGKASPLCNSRGEVTGAIESIRDFTERRRLEDSLQQLNKKLSLLSSITRHDITNNLTVCRGYMALSKQKSPPAETLDLIAILEKNIGIIQSQLDFARVYQDLGASAPLWQDIGELLGRCSAAQKIPVISKISHMEVYADLLIGKVFYNLHDNAVRHGKHATEIHVHAEKRGNDMIIVWEDNGIGIPLDEKEMIFERGFGKNTGLGLFLVKEILSITGIAIRETGEPGKGARFEMTVPKGAWRIEMKSAS